MEIEVFVKLFSESDLYRSFISYLTSLSFLPELTNVISDTYTLIVGFVAIGIPLAIQIAGQVTEKYDNTLLAKRLTQGLFVTPVSLIIISVLYIILSMTFKLNTDFPSNDIKLLMSFLLCTLFPIIFISASWFYIRLYYRSITETERYCKIFLKLERPMLLTSLITINTKAKNQWIAKVISHYEGKRLSKSNLTSVNAGLEVLIEQLKNKSWESEFTEILFAFHKKINIDYFGKYNETVNPLSSLDVKLIKMYWDTLNRIIRVSRENEDAKLSFHSQRLLASVLSQIVHHSQYDLLVANSYNITDDNKINWSSDIYEIARWQSNQSGKGIDLIIECEWFRDIFGITQKIQFKNGSEGVISAGKTIIDVLYLVANDHPSKILKIYKNISENLHGECGQPYCYSCPNDKSMRWISKFWTDFNKTEFTIYNIGMIDDLLSSLSDGRAYARYGNYPSSEPLTVIEVKNARDAIDIDEFYESIFLTFVKGIGWEFSAWLAFSKRWQEFYDCLEWKQPRETTGSYIGEVMLASHVVELLELILKNYKVITSRHRFHDRHEIAPYAFRAFLFQLCYFYEKGNSISLLYPSGSIDDSKAQKEILKKLLEQEKQIIGNIFSNKVVYSVGDEIRKSIVAIDLRMSSHEKSKPIATDKWLTLKNEIELGWNEGFKLSKILSIDYKKQILQKDLCLLKHKVNRKLLIECSEQDRGGYYYGKSVANNLIQELYNRFIDIAKTRFKESIVIDNSLVFASKDKLKALGFSGIERGQWEHSQCAKSIAFTANSEEVLIIDCNKVSLNLSSNTSSFEGETPLFIHYNDTNEAKVDLFVYVYYDILGVCDEAVTIA
ncbi:hypothetical protein DS885_15240 [Psychromonas sp. B3M02]|uniref:hypothetical protein n=1 Tax=Psychromonas sp. B3M02 TaxID=2267226 RepID=UPI000DEA8C74|nr:hypothetical protein [Psychromonas sp. B3M02]RBW42584.1 hypothetical protein DS885_15240 [Psychromonas sp. B3M02]